MSKAFDRLPHSVILSCLKAHGITGNLLGWIRQWLANRTQIVVFNDQLSQPLPVTSGVPQGSVLGPILFLLTVNDLDLDLTSPILKFVDDSKLIISIPQTWGWSHIQHQLSLLQSNAETRDILWNPLKSAVMHLGGRNPHLTPLLSAVPIPSHTTHKDLGVTIDSQLTFTPHINNIIAHAHHLLTATRRTFISRHPTIIKTLYTTYIRPCLEHATQVWSPSSKNTSANLSPYKGALLVTCPKADPTENAWKSSTFNPFLPAAECSTRSSSSNSPTPITKIQTNQSSGHTSTALTPYVQSIVKPSSLVPIESGIYFPQVSKTTRPSEAYANIFSPLP
eukprot:Selendium_serpulae@DN6460_c0_g1_i4.p1